jgi:hypothetical protein
MEYFQQAFEAKPNNKWEMSMQHILSLTRQFEALKKCERGSNHILKLVGN